MVCGKEIVMPEEACDRGKDRVSRFLMTRWFGNEPARSLISSKHGSRKTVTQARVWPHWKLKGSEFSGSFRLGVPQ